MAKRFACATLLVSVLGCTSPEPADLVLRNGIVITMDEALPRAEAVAIRGDRIVAVGTNAEIDRYAGGGTEVLDLEGATAVPGLIDAHMHFDGLGWLTRQLFLDETRSPEEATAVVERRVREVAAGEWVTGQGWHTVTWGMPGFPDNSRLNEISPENPVYLVGMASHAAWVNERALAAAGITRDTPDPPGGQIVKDPGTGAPTGILTERAMDLVSQHLPKETRESRKADIERSVEAALAFGLTSVHDAGVGYEEIDLYKELLAEGKLGVRLYVMFRVPDAGEELDRYIENPPEIGLGNHHLTLRSIKVFADGALGARGAAMLEPYSDAPAVSGLVQNDEEELYRLTMKAIDKGYQVCAHAIGDRGNRNVLSAFERAMREFQASTELRHRIEHAQILAPDDVSPFYELGIIASMQPIHAPMDMGFAEARVGPERIRGAYAWRSLLDAGAKVVSSADTPAFPLEWSNPLWGIYAAVTRQDLDGNPPGGWYPEQRMTPHEALKSYTLDAAYAAFEEDIKGSLTPGKLADVTVLSRNILEVPPREILETRVKYTLVGGRIAFSAP